MNHSTVDIGSFFVARGCPVLCEALGSILGLHPVDARSIIPSFPSVTPRVSPVSQRKRSTGSQRVFVLVSVVEVIALPHGGGLFCLLCGFEKQLQCAIS